jgi:hypothetical protein
MALGELERLAFNNKTPRVSDWGVLKCDRQKRYAKRV